MPIKYTIFPLTSSTTTNILTIGYDTLLSASKEDQEYFDSHLIEATIYSLNQLIFTDFVISEIKVLGRRPVYTLQRTLNKLTHPVDYFKTILGVSPRPSNYSQLVRLIEKAVNSGSNLYP